MLGGRIGEIRIWYSRTMPVAMSRATVLFDPFPDPPAESGDLGTDGMEGEPFDMHFTLRSKHEDKVCRNPMVHCGCAKGRALETEGFTHQPPEPVAADGVKPLMGNRITCAKDRLLRGLQQIDALEKSPARPAPPGEHAVETLVATQRAFAFHLPFVADRQLLASACTATGKNLASVLGRHTLPKSVRVATLSFMRLICALHELRPDMRLNSYQNWTKQHNITKSIFKFNTEYRKMGKNSLARPPLHIV